MASSSLLCLRLRGIDSGLTRRVLAVALAVVGLAGGGLAPALGAQGLPEVGELTIKRPAAARTEQLQVLVELVDPPAAVVWAAALAGPSDSTGRADASASGGGSKVSTLSTLSTLSTAEREEARQRATAATRAHLARLAAAQATVAARLSGAPFHGREIYRVQRALNAIAVFADRDSLAEMRRLPGVKAVHVLVPEVPLNATSVPFINAPQLWGNTLGLPANITGAGVKIGIIDTGIDYQHPMFGGSGLLADYQANDRVTINPSLFPTAKVVGGTDFAGDAYTGSNAPVPDPNPTDCFGHGSHVAGTAAGFGVNSDGTTYTGGYGPTTPFAAMRIGPGAAPRALLYALRIFGCSGSTNLTPQAIDWSIDPNNDGDFSDHLDVINMSLGSAYGGISDTSAMASENAALAGVIVVAAAGNSGDTYFIHGSPGSSTRTIAVAASADPGVPGGVVTVNSPAAIAGGYPAAPAAFGNGAPNPSGQTANVILVNAGTGVASQGCSALTNAAAVAGNIALVDRGTCSFQTKAATAQAAGAIGVIVVNNVPGDPSLLTMGADATQPNITIPAVLISSDSGTTIKSQLANTVNATLASASAADSIASFSSRGPRNATPPIRLKPDITAPGVNIPSDQTGMTCMTGGGCITPTATGFDPGGQVLTISGTSMATPHVAGSAALMRQLHPDWSVEEIKAVMMNGAVHDVTLGDNGSGGRLGLGRVGSGRIDDAQSAVANVTAFDDEGVGAVSLSFDREVVGTLTQVKTVRLVNHGATDQTFTLGVDTTDPAAGVTFSLPGGSAVTVPAGQSTTFDVQMSANASLMTHVLEPTVASVQAAPAPLTSLGNLSRHFLNEAGAYLTFSQSSSTVLRLPLYAAARPTSAMAGPTVIATGGAPTGSTTLALSGTAVCTGTLGAGPTCTASLPHDEVSLVSPFELQAVHPIDPTLPAYFNIRYAGVSYDPATNLLLFGIATWGPWATPADVAFNVTVNGTRVLFNSDPGNMAANLFGTANVFGQDAFITGIFNTATSGVSIGTFVNRVAASTIDTRLFDNSVMILAATPATLGLSSPTTPFTWSVQSCPGFDPLCFNGAVDAVPGPFTWEYAAAGQGLNFNGGELSQDLNGASLPVTFNTANLTAHASQGALLLHHHNKAGTTAQVIPVQGTSSADLSIVKSMAPTNPTLGQNVTFTLTLSNAGPGATTAAVVSDPLPDGLTYVSDDGAGAYDSTTGQWTVGPLAMSASATLHIVATVASTDPIVNTATISSSNLLDPNPANDQSSVTVAAPRAADVALSMSVSSPTVQVGGSVTYTLTVKNLGDDTSYSVNVQEAFPAFPSLTPTGSTASAGVFNSATGVWDLGSLAKNATETLALTFTAPNTAGALTNNATASASTSDPANSNNSASATTTVLSPAQVSGVKTVTGTFTPGGAVTYTIVLTNNGTFAQQDNPGDEFDDTLPASLVLTSGSATSGVATVDLVANSVSWNGAIAAGGGTVTITIHATVASGTSGGTTVANQGTIHYDADGNGTNESTAQTGNGSGAGATTFVVPSPAQVSGTKTVTGSFTEHGTVTYTIVLTNNGTSAQLDNPGDELDDTLPASLILASATATSGAAVATVGTNTVSWNGSIPAGGTVTITILATIAGGTAGTTISNQGTIHYDADGDGTNESTALTGNGSGPGATTFLVAGIAQVPTLSPLGLGVLLLLLAAAGVWFLSRRRAAHRPA